MKILFICRANIGRSQSAAGFYNATHPGMADSAGTIVDIPGEKISERPGAANIIAAMHDYDIDISNGTRTQLNPDMVDTYDKLIVMAEPDTIPEWLRDNAKTEIWTIADPKGQDMDTTRGIVGQIKDRVLAL